VESRRDLETGCAPPNHAPERRAAKCAADRSWLHQQLHEAEEEDQLIREPLRGSRKKSSGGDP
jgi:hypothetical protein